VRTVSRLQSSYLEFVFSDEAEAAARTAVRSFREALQVPVDDIYWMRNGSEVRIWTVIPEPDEAVQERIYKAEVASLRAAPNMDLDFRVLFRRGRPIAALRPEGSKAV
jgi:hypothetical protein